MLDQVSVLIFRFQNVWIRLSTRLQAMRGCWQEPESPREEMTHVNAVTALLELDGNRLHCQ